LQDQRDLIGSMLGYCGLGLAQGFCRYVSRDRPPRDLDRKHHARPDRVRLRGQLGSIED
jgi:hypothetical protein